MTTFLGQASEGQRKRAGLLSRPGPLRLGVLNHSHQPEIKHRRTVVLGVPTARYRQVKDRDLTKA